MEDDFDWKYKQEIAVPDNMVGLGEYNFKCLFITYWKCIKFFVKVIGQDGEHIKRVEAKTGAKIEIGCAGVGQFLPDRTFTITGTRTAMQ